MKNLLIYSLAGIFLTGCASYRVERSVSEVPKIHTVAVKYKEFDPSQINPLIAPMLRGAGLLVVDDPKDADAIVDYDYSRTSLLGSDEAMDYITVWFKDQETGEMLLSVGLDCTWLPGPEEYRITLLRNKIMAELDRRVDKIEKKGE